MECVLFLAYGKKRALFCTIDMESGLQQRKRKIKGQGIYSLIA